MVNTYSSAKNMVQGYDVNETGIRGMTPLHWAVKRGLLEVIHALIDNNTTTNNNNTNKLGKLLSIKRYLGSLR